MPTDLTAKELSRQFSKCDSMHPVPHFFFNYIFLFFTLEHPTPKAALSFVCAARQLDSTSRFPFARLLHRLQEVMVNIKADRWIVRSQMQHADIMNGAPSQYDVPRSI